MNPGPVDTSNASTFTVNPSPITTTQLFTTAGPWIFGQTITLSASVSPPAATGKVTFYEGTSMLGIATLVAGGTVVQFRTSLLPAGSGTLKAYYSGDGFYFPSTSAPAGECRRSTYESFGYAATAGAGESRSVVGRHPLSRIAGGDFNGDGYRKISLSPITMDSDNVTVLLGNSSGGFSAAQG